MFAVCETKSIVHVDFFKSKIETIDLWPAMIFFMKIKTHFIHECNF